ncbi:hypothetical protein KHS38_05300 [Mucilaginibacter sp. Bleaf8]|uniref:hypothetical protein n=1 Tax=Mucilaginibacter sp. Bleaf8 TaxID=2834430 RepID=UPI001BCED502|nr:hypothetical protein [Mucilaginibacter sp. Bleaf8]MBS7563812.1 hypothetical protein [Mucilaginibacter sp. Bleaf8]
MTLEKEVCYQGRNNTIGNLLLAMLIIMFSVACNRSQKTKISIPSGTDTITLNDNEVIFISPSDQSIKKLKKKQGEDFYTVADDANNYFAEASSYLDSLEVSYKSYDDNKIIVFNKNNKSVKIPRHTSPWYVIFYKDGRYETLDLINVKEGYSKFFNNKSPVNRNHLYAKPIIDSIAEKKYSVVEEKECDLNTDGFRDMIIVFGNNSDIDTQDPTTKIAPVALLLNEQNKKYTVLINENIYPNNFGDAFKRLVVKNNYFTIELLNEIPDQYISEKYVTFKFNKVSKEVILSKYGESIDWNDGKRNETLCSDKDLGRILFQAYNSNTIQAKCKN